MTHQPSTRPTGEPRLGALASWLVLTASFGLSASTWIALAVLAGFTAHTTALAVTLRLAWLMPIAVDGYVVVALVLWMAPVPAKVAAFARKNTYLAASIGIAAQSAYHGLLAWSTTGIAWRTVLAAIVGALPPAVAGLAVHMRALIRRESTTSSTTVPAHPVNPVPMSAVPQPTTPAALTESPRPARTTDPDPVSPVRPVPTPSDLAARITPPRPTDGPVPAAAPGAPARPVRPEPRTPRTTPAQLAPSATDTHVTGPDAAHLMRPVAPALLAQAVQIAGQYRNEHGTPITAGRLAVRMKVTSEQAAHLLALINLTPTNPTVNGHRPQAVTR